MRAIVSIVVAFALFIFVAILAYSGNVVLPDYWTGLAVALTAAALAILYWGFRPQINRLLNEKKDSRANKAETIPAAQGETQKIAASLGKAQITKLSINNNLLDDVYEQAQRKAIEIYHDAQLSGFMIQVLFFDNPRVNIYLDFYSKWGNKTCVFRYDPSDRRVEHSPPDKHPVFGSQKEAFTTLPWKESPQWMQFIERVYAKIGPLTPVKGTHYYLSAFPTPAMGWVIRFEDGFTGAEYAFKWNGKGFDEKSISQTS